uniref:O-antigen ligase family protein n=1 Tax=Roseivirga sp. TaxID=1964215 RepID=UPI004047D5FB
MITNGLNNKTSISGVINTIIAGLFFLFAYSGLTKWVISFVDTTLLFGVLTLFGCVILSNRKIKKIGPFQSAIILFVLLHFWFCFSALYSLSQSYYQYKLFIVLTNFAIFFLPILIFRDEQSFASLKKLAFYFLVLAEVILLYELLDNNLRALKYTFGEEDSLIPNYQTVSYFLGSMVILMANSAAIYKRIVLLIAVLFMILLSAKGPLLFIMIAFLVRLKNFRRLNIKNIILIAILGGGVFYGATRFLQINVFSGIAGRLLFFTDGLEADQSSYDRLILLSHAYNVIIDNWLLGVGIGGFSNAVEGIDGRMSPHNLFLEVWSEMGLIALLILAFMIYRFFRLFRQNINLNSDYTGVSLVLICLFLFLGNMVSSILEDLRVTYFWLGMAVAFYSMSRRKEIDNVWH